MDRAEIAAKLRDTAGWLRFRGDKGFRARAYERGAAAIDTAANLASLIEEQRLTSLPGIGAALAAQVEELARTGRSKYLDDLMAGLPPGVLEIAEQGKLSPKKTLALHELLGVSSYADLLIAARAGKLRDLKGFGEKTEARLLEGGKQPSTHEPRMILDEARALAEELATTLRQHRVIEDVIVAGESRRACETIRTITLVTVGDDATAALDAVAKLGHVGELLARDERTLSARLVGGLQLEVFATRRDRLGAVLLEATGPAAHMARVSELLLGVDGPPRSDNEAAIYATAGLPLVPPEQRDRSDVIEAALDGEVFDDLLKLEDLRGIVHCHTSYSDGRNTVEEMARAAQARGFSYITITDHSPTAHYAGGVELDRLRKQWDEIEEVQEKVAIRILRGTESDITKDGALDYPDAVLEKLDIVIASVHNRYRLDREAMTERIVRAMRHPLFKIWGHALGRILLSRPPFECDVERIFDVIAENGAAIEVNGDPHRMDLPPALMPSARARGISFVVSADAHSTRGLDAISYGVEIARRGGLRRSDVLNTRFVDDFLDFVRPARA